MYIEAATQSFPQARHHGEQIIRRDGVPDSTSSVFELWSWSRLLWYGCLLGGRRLLTPF
jgi:hypothetical protein